MSGNVYWRLFNVAFPKLDDQKELKKVLFWADEVRSQKGICKSINGSADKGLFIWSNINNIQKVKVARENGAEGIGMFNMETLLDESSINEIQKMILRDDFDSEESQKAVDSYMTKVGDQLTTNLPTTVRLINWPTDINFSSR